LWKLPQRFCLPRRHVGHIHFGTWGLANSIRFSRLMDMTKNALKEGAYKICHGGTTGAQPSLQWGRKADCTHIMVGAAVLRDHQLIACACGLAVDPPSFVVRV